MAAQETIDHLAVLGRQHRTGGIDQAATFLEQYGTALEQRQLCGGEGIDVFGPAQQLDVRMPADHTGAGAWRVEQDAVEEVAIPPGQRMQVGRDEAGSETQPFEVLANAPEARRIDVEGGELELAGAALEDVAALAA